MSSQADCLFCKMITGEIPAGKVLESDRFLAFNDINPQAPTHVLVIPKHHAPDIAQTQDPQIFADTLDGLRQVAEHLGLKDYRVVVNNGSGAGQTVFHLHMHLLAGRPFLWPPG